MFEEVSRVRCFDGWQKVMRHDSKSTQTPMHFGIYIPDLAAQKSLPAMIWLSGLTCTHENFVTKAGSQALASEHGCIIITPDTSPRGAGINGEDDAYDFGTGAGFYIDATQNPYAQNYKMESYLMEELLPRLLEDFPIDSSKLAISGHSMGGHGALTLALKYPDRFASVSAFAPIAAPSNCPWGEKAFAGYLGPDKEVWKEHDATALIQSGKVTAPMLVDQGLADNFLQAGQLQPEKLEEAARSSSQKIEFRYRQNFDHSYYYIASFLREHFQWHHHQWNA